MTNHSVVKEELAAVEDDQRREEGVEVDVESVAPFDVLIVDGGLSEVFISDEPAR